MPDNALNLRIVVDNTVPQAMAQAAAAVEDSTTQIRSSFTKVQTVIKDSEDKIRYSMTEARHAIRGVGEEVGIHMPRFVSTFLAELPAVGAAMASAFSVVAIVGIVEMVATTLPKAFDALQEKITGWGEAARLPSIEIFHAGTARDGDRLMTAGGRVLVVTATGPTMAEAAGRAYEAADRIQFEGKHLRRDIGRRIV